MIRLLAVASRSIPLMIALVLVAVIVYFVVRWRKSPAAAKEVLIRLFLVLCIAISAIFLIISLYAVVDRNDAVFELAASCLLVGVVGLGITLLCRWRFRKNNPHYKEAPNARAKPISDKPSSLSVLIKLLTMIDDRRKGN